MRISSAWRSVTVLVLPSAGLAHPAAAVRSRNPVANCRVRYRVCCGDACRFQNTGSLRSLYRARGECLASVSERRKCVKHHRHRRHHPVRPPRHPWRPSKRGSPSSGRACRNPVLAAPEGGQGRSSDRDSLQQAAVLRLRPPAAIWCCFSAETCCGTLGPSGAWCRLEQSHDAYTSR